MKLVTYNLRYGGVRGEANHWRQLLRDFQPDIVFAQESLAPGEYFAPEQRDQFRSCLYRPVPHGKWGCAPLSPTMDIEAVGVDGFDGWVVGGKIANFPVSGAPGPAMAFSLHAPSPGPYEPSVDNILDAIAKVWDGTPLIIAGDFNITTAVRHASEEIGPNTPGERRILTRMRKEFGLVNVWQLLNPNENLPQTLRWARDPVPPYHCDGIFIDQRLIRSLSDVRVEGAGPWATLSDHNPIIASFD